MKAAHDFFINEANMRLDIVDLVESAFVGGVEFSAKFSESFKEDRFGKLERFQIADGLRELMEEES